MAQVIVVGGGLSGLSAAHTILERGGRVLVLDKNALLGGNSTKATSGINGALTRTQIAKNIPDSAEIFLKDTALSASKGTSEVPSELAKVLVYDSASSVHWLQDRFNLDLSLISRLGGHSQPRTHRGKERFPGMTITYALMEKLEDLTKNEPHRARIVTKARVTKLVTESTGAVTGVVYEKDGQSFTEYGPVIIATGGYGADYSEDSLLKKYRPDILHLPTTNGDHCTGDGIKMAIAIGADLKDITAVQVHPTGLVHPDEPDAKLKFLAAEALRGVGGIMIDGNGKRFCNELGRRDYVSEEMVKGKGPFRLILNSGSAKEIEWHCKHYVGRGLMKRLNGVAELAKDSKVSQNVIESTFAKYNEAARTKKDEFGRQFFDHAPMRNDDVLHVAVVTPVVHYCMGGIRMSPDSEVVNQSGVPIPGLFAAGEVMGGVHGQNRLGGSSLLDCVVFGRVAGNTAARYQLSQLVQGSAASVAHRRAGSLAGQLAGSGLNASVSVDPKNNTLSIDIQWGSNGPSSVSPAAAQTPSVESSPPPSAPKARPSNKVYTLSEVGNHKTEQDCWVVVNGQVLDVSKFLPDHPGGKKAIMLFAGKDASEEFNMLHKPDVVAKYAPDSIIGQIEKGTSSQHTLAKL